MSDTYDPEYDQQLPVHVPGGASMHDLLVEDIASRKAMGLKKYGTVLQTNNGRSFLKDAYAEILDMAVYVCGAIEEMNERERLECIVCQSGGVCDAPHTKRV